MKKTKLALLLLSLFVLPLAGCGQASPTDSTSGTTSGTTSGGTSADPVDPGDEETIDPDYPIVFDEHVHLTAGEITSRIGVHFHFDEKAVTEKPEDAFMILGPYGGIYLQNYIPGIQEVYVQAVYDGGYIDEGGYVVGISATPNSVEHFQMTQTDTRVLVNLDRPYISIINRGNKNLIIKSIRFKYAEDLTEKALHDMIQVEDKSAKLDLNSPIKPYELSPIDESKIPDNRVVTKIGPEEYTLPGEYVYGYEVHVNLHEQGVGKLLYSSTANFKVSGTTDNKHIAVFHLENKDVLLKVNDGEKVDISSNEEIRQYDWNSKTNDLASPFTSDRHFYPVFNVVGVPTNKDGDGCHPIHTSYSMLDGKVNMPDPVMKDGYKFGGWFLDHACTQVFDADARHKGNITLYAKCIETTKSFRKVYYYDYDSEILNKVDYLNEEENASISIAKFDDIHTRLLDTYSYQTKAYELRVGANRISVLRPEMHYPFTPDEEIYAGDKLTYEMIKDYAGDIKLYVIRLEVYSYPLEDVLRFFTDLEENTVITGLAQEEWKAAEDEEHGVFDKILAGRYIDHDENWHFYDTYYDPVRADNYLVTDEVNGYIIDGGLFTTISSHGYGNKYKEHSKPLYGLLRHDSVIRVNRRAFFNRYGLVGTYFPRNAREFDLEAYANTHFNDYLLLPKNLKKIGRRCFAGSTNIHNVFLPLSLTEVGQGAFSISDYDENLGVFKDTRYRNGDEQITFYYEGSEKDFNRLDENTRFEIINNAKEIICNVEYSPCYSK